MNSRREFLRKACCSAASLGMGAAINRFGMMNAFAQTGTDFKALVCVFLFGGNDSNNLIVPLGATDYGLYQKYRSILALPQAQLLPVATSKNAAYGFHPNMTELQQLFIQKKLGVVANVGTLVKPISVSQYQQGAAVPSNLFSHSDQQAEWQTAVPQGGGKSGWGGRVADALSMIFPSPFPTAVSVAGNSMFVNGITTQPTSVQPGATGGLDGSNGSAEANARDTAFEHLLTLDSGVSLVASEGAITKAGLDIAKVLQSVLSNTTTIKTAFPNSSLGQELLQVAKMIQARAALGMSRQIFFVSLGGFDTHTNQLGDQGTLFQQLSQAMGAFYNATVELGVATQVTSFTESDFGRTFQPSSGAGSDHAWGSHHLVMGGAVKGDLYGAFPQLQLNGPNDVDGRGVWLPTTGLDQYGATLASWFGVSGSSLNTVFPNLANFGTAANLGFV